MNPNPSFSIHAPTIIEAQAIISEKALSPNKGMTGRVEMEGQEREEIIKKIIARSKEDGLGENKEASPETEIPVPAKRINLLCVYGASVGVISLLLPWLWNLPADGAPSPSYLFEFYTSYNPILMLLPTTFVFGLLLAFLSPIGGLFQVPTTLLMCSLWSITAGPMPFGAFLGLASAMISLFSWFIPWGIGFEDVHLIGHRLTLRQKIWNFKLVKVGERA